MVVEREECHTSAINIRKVIKIYIKISIGIFDIYPKFISKACGLNLNQISDVRIKLGAHLIICMASFIGAYSLNLTRLVDTSSIV